MKYPKKNPAGRPGLSGVLSPRNDDTNTTINSAVWLDADQIKKVLKTLPYTAKQARRFVAYVAANPHAPTASCNVAAAAVNLSDVAIKYNPYLLRAGYKLKCRRPGKPIKNRFGEESGQVHWALYQISGEAT